jgi:hypothetical protein
VNAKLRALMTFSAAIACPYGAACIAAPEWWMSVWGLDVAGHGVLLARMYGGQVLGFGVLSALARNTPESPARRAIVTGFAFVDAVSFGIALWAVGTGVVGALGWVDVAAFFGFAAAFGWFAYSSYRVDGSV